MSAAARGFGSVRVRGAAEEVPGGEAATRAGAGHLRRGSVAKELGWRGRWVNDVSDRGVAADPSASDIQHHRGET